MLHAYFKTVFSTDKSLIVDPGTLYDFLMHFSESGICFGLQWFNIPHDSHLLAWHDRTVQFKVTQYDKVKNTTCSSNQQ